MNRLVLFVIEHATPKPDREFLVGDTIEAFNRIERTRGGRAARQWLRGELWRVLLGVPRHRLVVRSRRHRSARRHGDGPMAAIAQDFRHAVRLLARSPGFAVIVIVTLALGIGANTAMFAVLNAILLKPLPFTDADRLMLVHLTTPTRENPEVLIDSSWSYPKYQTFVSTQQVFESTALFSGRQIILAGEPEPERVRAELISERYPAILGIEAILGRTFSKEEVHTPAAPATALIGHALWTRRFGSDPGVIGRSITINATPYTIVGVLPPGFNGLNGNASVWLPIGAFQPSDLLPDAAQSHSYRLIARRHRDVSEQSALTAVHLAGAHINAAHLNRFARGVGGARAVSIDASRIDVDVHRGSLVLLAAVGCVLLIACVNLANLAGARAIARGREVAVRVAMGASRGRIIRQCFAEGMLLAGMGAFAGLLVAIAILRAAALLFPGPDVFFQSAVAPGVPRTTGAAGLTRIGASMIGLDTTTIWFTVGVGVITAVLVSLLPAWRVSAIHPAEMLKATGRWATDRGLHAFGARAALVTAQIALALILLTGAGLMIKSAMRLYGTNIGVAADGVVTIGIGLPTPRYTSESGLGFYAQLVERTRAIPGVASVALGNCPPVSGGCSFTNITFPPAVLIGGGKDPLVGVHWITPEYLSTLGLRLVNGRNFTDRDRVGQPRVVLVNESAVRTFWPNQSPIGKRITVGQGGFHVGAEIVGVVSDVRYVAIESAPTPDVFLPLAQSFISGIRLYIRSGLPPAILVPAITRELRTLDPNVPLGDVKTMSERMDDAMWRTRVGAWLLSAFAALALLLTAIGIFGVMAQTVMQRTSEIGIRMALGADRRDVLSLVLRHAALVTGNGLLLGILGALALARVISGFLYETERWDPGTFAAVAGVVAFVAFVACYIPARRATRVDAAVTLRGD